MVGLMQKVSSSTGRRSTTAWSILDEPEPTPLTLPSAQPRPALPDPDVPLSTPRQIRLYNALQLGGVAGVAHVIYQECEDMIRAGGKDQSSYRTMLEDRSKGTHYVSLLLMSLPKHIIESLIKGTLPCDRYRRSSVKDFVLKHMRSGDYPAIYINYLVHPPASILPGVNPQHAGKWLSTSQINRALTAHEAYIADTDPKTNDLIDKQFGRKMGSREWADTAIKKEKGRVYTKTIRAQFCTGIDPKKIDVPHQRAPCEVGVSKNCKRRIADHTNNRETTYIFGYNNAFNRLSISQGGFGFGEPFSAILFPIWKPDLLLARVAEILGSMLTGSYAELGGYNCTQAGTFSDLSLPDDDDLSWKTAKKHLADRFAAFGGPADWELQSIKLAQDLDTWKKGDQARKEYDEKVKKARDFKQKLKETRQEKTKALEDLRRVYDMHKEAERNYLERLNRGTKPGEKPLGDQLKELKDKDNSLARVQEEYERRRLLRYSKGGDKSYTPGPLVAMAPLTDEEKAQVNDRLAKFQLRVHHGVDIYRQAHGYTRKSSTPDEELPSSQETSGGF
ncbi:MAG: hypothetical protein Q9170_004664 [Blastenia crenularia]